MSGSWTMNYVCEQWMLRTFDGSLSADRFMKERLSLIELGFRKYGEDVAYENSTLQKQIEEATARVRPAGALYIPGDRAAYLRAANQRLNSGFQALIDELNARFRQAGCDLNYHNGFIQRSSDALVLTQVETPFWLLVAEPRWKNVDMDMKEAVDLRDSNGRDPAFFAARALESTIKIISDEKGWSKGKESGAHAYIDNLARANFLPEWEVSMLKLFFTKVRNPLSHGPGAAQMPKLSEQQTDWAIEAGMSWIKTLIRRA